jgi:hypothetical protein
MALNLPQTPTKSTRPSTNTCRLYDALTRASRSAPPSVPRSPYPTPFRPSLPSSHRPLASSSSPTYNLLLLCSLLLWPFPPSPLSSPPSYTPTTDRHKRTRRLQPRPPREHARAVGQDRQAEAVLCRIASYSFSSLLPLFSYMVWERWVTWGVAHRGMVGV